MRPALRTLSLREILRATRKRYDSVPIGQADQMLIALLDVNGRALAMESLAALAKREDLTAAGTDPGDASRNAAAAQARRRKTTHPSTDAPSGTFRSEARSAEAVAAAPDLATPAAAATPPVRHHRDGGESGAATGLVVLAILATLSTLVTRRIRAVHIGP